MGILGIIPARGGSKGVKDKNIMEIAGRPLIAYTIDAVLESQRLDKVVVSTDSPKIAAVVRELSSIDVIMRPPELARDDSPIEESFFHAVEYLREEEGFDTEILVWTQPNVPIRKPGVVDEALGKLLESDADSCVTCYETDQVPEVMKRIDSQGFLVPLYRDISAIRRQEFERRYLLDGSVVVLRTANLYSTRGIRKAHVYLGEKTVPLVQEKMQYSLEIDVPDDVDLVRYFLER